MLKEGEHDHSGLEQGAKLNTVESIHLGADCLWISEMNEGQDVRVYAQGYTTYWVRCDFNNFAEDASNVTPEAVEKKFREYRQLEQFEDMDFSLRKLIFCCWGVALKVKSMLGPPLKDEDTRRESYRRCQASSSERNTIKPLSECKNESMCTEYTVLAKHLLGLAGVQSVLVLGWFEAGDNDPKAYAEGHAYLVLGDGKYIFDPVNASSNNLCWPPGLYKTEEAITPLSFRDKLTKEGFFVCEEIFSGERNSFG